MKFSDPNAAANAIQQFNGKDMGGRQITIEEARPPNTPAPFQGGAGMQGGMQHVGMVQAGGFNAPNGSTTCFVGNLPFSATEQDIRDFFSPCGVVQSVRLLNHYDTGNPRGIAYVDFVDEAGAAAATQWNGKEMQGRNLRVNFANSNQNNGAGGFRRGGFSGGGSGGFGAGGRGGFRGRTGGNRNYGNSDQN